ncbi:hypothetical protein D3C86_1305370 [compost metagenome]
MLGFLTSSAFASGLSTRPIGCEISSAAFCTVPKLRMMPLNCVINRPSRKLRRSTSASVKATAPELILPESHRSIQSAAMEVIITPDSSAMEARTPVMKRVNVMVACWKISKPCRM